MVELDPNGLAGGVLLREHVANGRFVYVWRWGELVLVLVLGEGGGGERGGRQIRESHQVAQQRRGVLEQRVGDHSYHSHGMCAERGAQKAVWYVPLRVGHLWPA